ncbi:MAG: PilZ domain-containing protein [Candidatus Eremiobacteraeota bacterium]|nr:PilZ domain-containing protein [Candidatus Eremiobacteraeota bacterium]
MFGWFRKSELVQFVKIEGRALTFKSERGYKLKAQPTIQIDIPIASGGSQRFKLPVTIRQVREVAKKQFICTGEVPGAAQSVEQLRQLLIGLDPMAAGAGEEDDDFANMRRSPRYPWSLRVLSKDLVGFQGVSIDFNKLGVKIATEGPAELGNIITMMLEIETAKTRELLCQGEVRWSNEIGRRRWEVGIEFRDLDPEVAKELEQFEKFLESRQTDNISKRTLIDSTLYVDDAFGPGVDALEEEEEPSGSEEEQAEPAPEEETSASN